jgi:hypothetical protein
MEQKPRDMIKLTGLVEKNAILSLVPSKYPVDQVQGAEYIVQWLRDNLSPRIMEHIKDILNDSKPSSTRHNKIEIGDRVKVIHSGCQYNSMRSWKDEYMPAGYTWVMDTNTKIEAKDGKILKVVAIKPHPNGHPMVFGLADSKDLFYMLDERGIELIEEELS